MVKPEFTGKRDLSYNIWHRTLGDIYYMIDLDCVEWRNGRGVVAIIERSLNTGTHTSRQILDYKNFELQVLSDVSSKLNVPAYLVFYDRLLTTFETYTVQNSEATPLKKMNNTEYADFIRSL